MESDVKLAQSEADKLLAFLRRTCRPQTPDDQHEFDHWAKRLTGSKS